MHFAKSFGEVLWKQKETTMGLLEDARNIQRLDPAAKSLVEVVLLYPGFHVLLFHRAAH